MYINNCNKIDKFFIFKYFYFINNTLEIENKQNKKDS